MLLVSRYPDWQDSNTSHQSKIEKDLETKLHMHNTKDNVALTNISQETYYFHDFELYPKSKLLAFPRPLYFLIMFLKPEHFSAWCSYKKSVNMGVA